MNLLALDIETLPDPHVWSPPADQPDAFPPPPAHRVLCIGYVVLDQGTGGFTSTVRMGVVEDPAEATVLRGLAELVRGGATVVTWNGRRFDLPVLMFRSMRYGLQHSWYYGSRDCRYRYSEQGHCDLADAMADYGATVPLSLDSMARLIGLPGKFGDIDGAGVAQAYATGRIADIGSYCMADAAQTAFLWLRWQHLTGRVTAAAYRFSADQLLESCTTTGRLDELVRLVDRRVLLLEGMAG